MMERKTKSQTILIQKSTEFKEAIKKILQEKSITLERLREFPKQLIEPLFLKLMDMANVLKGSELHEHIEKIDSLLENTEAGQSGKSQIWENNHFLITRAMRDLINEMGRMPTKNQIAERSCLCRRTIYKHLDSSKEHPLYVKQMDQFRFMSDSVLASVVREAQDGDTKAARLYFELMGMLNVQANNNPHIRNQNNLIQINGTAVSWDRIGQLSPEQLRQIEGIINSGNLDANSQKEAIPIPITASEMPL